MKKTGIYILKLSHHEDIYKIGCSNNLKSRLKSSTYTTTFLPEDMPKLKYILYFNKCSSDESIYLIEKLIHNILKPQRVLKLKELFKIPHLYKTTMHIMTQLNGIGMECVIYDDVKNVPQMIFTKPVVKQFIKTPIELNVNIKIITKPVKKIFTCDKCLQTFTRNTTLKKHKIDRCITSAKKREENKDKKFHCHACLTGFSRKDSMKKHKQTCKLNIQQQQQSSTPQPPKPLINNSHEEYSWISQQQWNELYNLGENGICKLIQLINFNPFHTENHNMLSSDNIESKFIKIFKNNKWKTINFEKLNKTLLNTALTTLKNQFSKDVASNNISTKTHKLFTKFLSTLSKTPELTNRLVEIDIRLIIYNNRQLVSESNQKRKLQLSLG